MQEDLIKARDAVDPVARLDALIRKLQPRFRKRFLDMVEQIRTERSIKKLANLIAAGRIDEALTFGEKAVRVFASGVNEAFGVVGRDTSLFFNSKLGLLTSFDTTNERAVRIMQSEKLRLIRGFSNEQKTVVREALADGIRRGLNPIEQARQFRHVVGLTSHQMKAVRSYRDLLQSGTSSELRRSLDRKLRDGNYDALVRAAIKNAKPLTKAQISVMVERYQERYVKYRAEVIARTEAIRAVNLANREMYQQAFDSGELDPAQVIRKWNTAKNERVRSSHAYMHGQERGFSEPFVSGDGNQLLHPGDPGAPAEDVVQCRCAVSSRILLRVSAARRRGA